MSSIKFISLIKDIKSSYGLRFYTFLLTFIIAIPLIHLVFVFDFTNYLNYPIIKINLILPQHSNASTVNYQKRPPDGYVIDINRVNKHCEPINYTTSTLRKYPVQNCLDYLDSKQADYLVKPSSPKYCDENDPMIFHVYWRGKSTEKIALMIKSFLYTQPLRCSCLYIWVDENYEDLRLDKKIWPLIRFSGKNLFFKKWVTDEQLNSDPIFLGWKSKISLNQNVVGFSDIVRFVLLYRYGGMYLDADVLCLRDMRPIYNLNFDFAYRWSFWTHYNTAILRLQLNSTIGRIIIKEAMLNNMNFHPMSIKDYISKSKPITVHDLNEHLYMMPVILFDPLWLKVDLSIVNQILRPNLNVFSDVFKPYVLNYEFPASLVRKMNNNPLKLRHKHQFFRGAFTYHWHNNWRSSIDPESWLGVLESAYDAFIEGLYRDENTRAYIYD
ncbi:41999_t:CDS:2 [Gigaspora margarita]|uniref:41999_t:CDS:1 n=1 Tax=Gigaspora margarita TaxID=4874 RepID=A0ABN7W4M0_GIGMA|nr:41999_t:CDS:2 [Gigaspora margarita]